MIEYINKLRVKSDDRLLRYSNISLEKIAEKCGFSGKSYFGEIYTKYMGMSPYQARKIKTRIDYNSDDYV